MQPILPTIQSPSDLKPLKIQELKQCAKEIRALITQSVLKNGGHLASSLGAVEIALALHKVFETPKDKIIWDVGHQAYAHKILTGRQEEFLKLRCDDGISGFPKPSESEHDSFIVGHASTSLSLALGFARARKIKNEDYKIAAVIGDGALTGGMAFEALNDIGASEENIIIILNDNDMSISNSVGGVNRHFSKVRMRKSYMRFKSGMRKFVTAIPLLGRLIYGFFDKMKFLFRRALKVNKMFEQMGIRYYGPFDGNDVETLTKIFAQANAIEGPVLVHLKTQKGCGFADAEKEPCKYHGVNPAGALNGGESFSSVAGESLCEIAQIDERVCAITAAMEDGTGLCCFKNKFENRFFDVGIAEAHAATMAAAMAKGGLKPYFAVYSSFLQRSYDSLIHDIAIDNLPVTLLIDRAGVIGTDGVTHQGVFDIAYLNSIPSMTILSPKDGNELREMIHFSKDFNAPLAIRYPKSFGTNYDSCPPIEIGKWEIIREENGSNKFIVATGSRMLDIAMQTIGATVINARCIKPLDMDFLTRVASLDTAHLITLEDGIINGGLGSCIANTLNQLKSKAALTVLGLKDNFIHTHLIEKAFNENGLTVENLQSIIQHVGSHNA